MPRSSSTGFADAPAAPRSIVDTVAFALALTVVLGVVYAVIAKVALDAFPYSGDEYSTYLQAQLFAAGQLHAPAPAHIGWLRVDHVVIDQLVRSKYPPGASALLALGLRAGAVWLVAPVEAMIALVLVWSTTRRLLGARAGLVALVTLGIAPLFVYNSSTFYAHTAATMFLAGAFAAVAAWTRSRHTGHLALTGVAIGCAFLVRPSDGVLFGVAMLCFRDVRAVVVPAVCALPLVGVNLWYQAAQFGSPFTDGYHAYQPTFTALYGAATAAHPLSPRHLVSIVQWWNHLDIFRAIVVDWTIPGCAVVALVGALALKDHPMRKFSLAVIAVFAVVLLAMISDPDDGARPRYLSIVLIPLAFLTAAGFAPACEALAGRLGRPIQRALVAIAVVFALAQTGSVLQDQIPKLWLREGLYQATAAAHLTDAVVIVRARYPSRYARNGPWFQGVLYLSVPPDVTPDQVAAAYPGKAVWVAHEGVPWRLVRFTPQADVGMHAAHDAR